MLQQRGISLQSTVRFSRPPEFISSPQILSDLFPGLLMKPPHLETMLANENFLKRVCSTLGSNESIFFLIIGPDRTPSRGPFKKILHTSLSRGLVFRSANLKQKGKARRRKKEKKEDERFFLMMGDGFFSFRKIFSVEKKGPRGHPPGEKVYDFQ